MEDQATTISEADLTRLLPTCQRCRRLRRKCDTQLPACRLCQKGKAECTFFDHALQQTLPRSYVHSLLNRLARLRSVQATISGGTLDPNAVASAYNSGYAGHERTISGTSMIPPQQDYQVTSHVSFDKHFSLEDANPTCWQYFGSSSPYALAVEVLVTASSQFGSLTHPENYSGPAFKLNLEVPQSLEPPRNRQSPSREELEMLVGLYMRSTNIINGHNDSAQTTVEIDTYLRFQGTPAKYLTGLEAHQFFRVAMICAIGAANKSRHEPHYGSEAFDYYLEALQCAEEVTSDISIDSLQALLLLVLFVLFYPRRGDVWKLLDYACRLSVELNIHCETNDEYEDEKSRQRRRSIFWGLYSLERSFGQHTGRPSDLAEEQITAEYPATLTLSPADQIWAQYMLVSHYYRLIYLRSEIFRVLYMPAIAPDLPRSWYEDRLDDFMAWRNETVGIVDAEHTVPGMGTMQIEMGFNTSVNFLFQPLLLRALVAIKDPKHLNYSGTSDLVVPRESYDAAVQSIDFYDRIVRAPQGTPEGDYPITIISTHYIHQAALTVMAHVLLAHDGRPPLLSFTRDVEGRSGMEAPPIDFSNIREISDVCLSLLDHCASRWAGMVGLLDLYREMHERIIPAIEARLA